VAIAASHLRQVADIYRMLEWNTLLVVYQRNTTLNFRQHRVTGFATLWE